MRNHPDRPPLGGNVCLRLGRERGKAFKRSHLNLGHKENSCQVRTWPWALPHIKFFEIAGFRENILHDRSHKEERQQTGKARIKMLSQEGKHCSNKFF